MHTRPSEFANRDGKRYLVTSINHLHQKARALVGLGKDFVIHSRRHTMLTRLGESNVDAFTIMKIAGHSSITVSQRYVHPSPEAVERAFERLQLSGKKGQNEPKVLLRPTEVPTKWRMSEPLGHALADAHDAGSGYTR